MIVPLTCLKSNCVSLSSQNSSKSRLRNLDQLHAYVTAATKELMWLNDKEEEEVNFDWSDRNSNMAAKKENYSVSLNNNFSFSTDCIGPRHTYLPHGPVGY